MVDLSDRVNQAFQEKFRREPEIVVRAPGRVNLLGEHVDYNDGFVLPAAINRAVWIACSSSTTLHSTLIALDLSEGVSFTPETIRLKTDLKRKPLPHWAKYPAGVVWALMEAGHDVSPIEAVFTSDVPRGSGLSSSAAVEMAFLTAFIHLDKDGRFDKVQSGQNSMKLAQIAQRAENKYVGVNCGIMDQFASACGVHDHVLFLDCRSLEWETVPLPSDVSIVIADTTVRRKLADSAYNDRRSACATAAGLLGVRSLRDVAVDDFHRNSSRLPSEVAVRAQHVVEEIQRTAHSVHLLKHGNVKAFGGLMNECHVSLRDLYQVSCPELDVMVEIAQSLPSCHGARLTGAGFGGCTVNLVEKNRVGDFTPVLASQYKDRTNREAVIYVCQAADGASLVSV